MLLSIIPSSIGDVFGRSLLISYLTLFPLFMDIFIRVLVLKIKGSTISNFSRIILGYSLITQLLFVYNLIQPIDFLTIFFSRGGILFSIFLFSYSTVKDAYKLLSDKRNVANSYLIFSSSCLISSIFWIYFSDW